MYALKSDSKSLLSTRLCSVLKENGYKVEDIGIETPMISILEPISKTMAKQIGLIEIVGLDKIRFFLAPNGYVSGLSKTHFSDEKSFIKEFTYYKEHMQKDVDDKNASFLYVRI